MFFHFENLLPPVLFYLNLVHPVLSQNEGECGLTCKVRTADVLGLRSCLKVTFDSSITLGISNVPKLVFPADEAYEQARETWKADMYPAAVVYAENNDEIKNALHCATENGYSVSARNGGHGFQGLATMHGHVVIDTKFTCNPDKFVVSRTSGEYILPGQSYIATMKVQAGCTNILMTSAVHKYFAPSDGALVVAATCPSVGYGGFILGGGSSDQTPSVGWASDAVQETSVILSNGTSVNASENENKDLFWALRGGGTGFGIVTDLTLKIVQSPSPKNEGERKFLYVNVQHDVSDIVKARKFLSVLQYFVYDFDPLVSSKFGGGSAKAGGLHSLFGVYLGSWQEFIEDWTTAGLLYEDFAGTDASDSILYQNYEVQSDIDLPPKGLTLMEFDSHEEAWTMRTCYSGLLSPDSLFGPISSYSTTDMCADLKINRQFCNKVEGVLFRTAPAPITVWTPKCEKKEVIKALLENPYDTNNFLNYHGVSKQYYEQVIQTPGNEDVDLDELKFSTKVPWYGGLLVPRLNIETMTELMMNAPAFLILHFQHGAPMLVPQESTAIPYRDTGIMFFFLDEAQREFYVSTISQDPIYGGDVNSLQGYINYMGPYGDPNWRQFFFGDHYDELQRIKGIYDPLDVFGKPYSVETPRLTKAAKKAKYSKKGKKQKKGKR